MPTRIEVRSFEKKKPGNNPIGVVMWDPERDSSEVRLLDVNSCSECISDHNYPLVKFLCNKLKSWLKSGNLPHTDRKLKPSEDEFWERVRELLTHRIRLSEPYQFGVSSDDQVNNRVIH